MTRAAATARGAPLTDNERVNAAHQSVRRPRRWRLLKVLAIGSVAINVVLPWCGALVGIPPVAARRAGWEVPFGELTKLTWGAGSSVWNPPITTKYVVARGWPFPAIACRVEHLKDSAVGELNPDVYGAIRIGKPRDGSHGPPLQSVRIAPILLPYTPIWPGIVLNTLVLAVTVLIPDRVRAFLRRFAKIDATKCESCGYSLIGLPSPVCPECGHDNGAIAGM